MKFLIEDKERLKLNPLLWDNFKLDPNIRDKLLEISNKFIEGLKEKDIPLKVVDIQLVGSNASYNYSNKSDIDVHIIADMDNISESNKKLLYLIYDYYKSNFNDKYDIVIKDIPVELYIEDKNINAISNGKYSLYQNEWVVKPKYKKPMQFTPQMDKLYNYIKQEFENIKLIHDKDRAKSLLDTLYFNRAKSLKLEGEQGLDNLIFKRFRSEGYLDELKKLIYEEESKVLSLEDLREMLD